MSTAELEQMLRRHRELATNPMLRQETIAAHYAGMALIASDMLHLVKMRQGGMVHEDLDQAVDLLEFKIRTEYIKAFGAAPSWPGQMMQETAPQPFEQEQETA